MRDRIALAISGSGVTSAKALRKADAVLSELETPTEGMKLAMSDEAQEYAICDSNAPLAIFTAAIRAAREGK
ncbi:hypothetical protein C4587_00775 [Candidatus Parcubacteria bacterium]|nr:MAG: hypothetical protein C4587_00775 [Candidatus Parcubacteria bacterium]